MIQTAITTALVETANVGCTPLNDGSTPPNCVIAKDVIQTSVNYMGALVVLFASLTLATVSFLLGQRHFRNDKKLSKMIESYDIRSAHCATESDRGVLLDFVNELFAQSGRDAADPREARENPELG